MDHTNDMNEQDLDAHLIALRSAMGAVDAPRCVEKELMQAFAKQFPRRRWYQRLATPGWSVAASFASVGLVVLAFVLAPAPGGIDPRSPYQGTPAGSGEAGDFIALASFDRIAAEPRPSVVQTEVARTALAPLGVVVTPENAGDSVRAELLVGADGAPLALRLTSLE